MTIERDDYLITIRPSDDESPKRESVSDKGTRYINELKVEIMLMKPEIDQMPTVIELTQSQHDCLVEHYNAEHPYNTRLLKIEKFLGYPVKIVGGE